MQNTKRLEQIRHYYVEERLEPMAIARILKGKKTKPTLETMRNLVNYYIKKFNIKRKEIKHYK